MQQDYYYIHAPESGRTVYSSYLEPFLNREVAENKLAPFLKERLTLQAWNRMFESATSMKDILTQEDAEDFKSRATPALPKGVTTMKRKFESKIDASTVELPKIKFAKAKIEFEESATLEENAVHLGNLLVDNVEAIASSLLELSGLVSSLVVDVRTLDFNLSSLITDIRTNPGVADGLPFSTVWRAIQYAAKLANVGLDKIRNLERDIKNFQIKPLNDVLKDMTEAKLRAIEADNKAGDSIKISQDMRSYFST